jgi:hypothetical protein
LSSYRGLKAFFIAGVRIPVPEAEVFYTLIHGFLEL